MFVKKEKEICLKRILSANMCILLAASQLLTGCSLIPQENETPAAPVLNSFEAESYDIAYVERGTVLSQKTIDCSFTQAKEKDVMFNISGKSIEMVYYKEGDMVKKGDLLAQLKLGNLDNDISDRKYEIGKLKIMLSQTKELMNLEIDKQQLISKGTNLSKEESDKAISYIKESYVSSIQNYEDSLYIKNKELDSLEDKEDNYKLYASMDGTVSFVKKDLIGRTCKKDEVIFTIIDNSSAVFQSKSKYAKNFKDGEEVTIDTYSNSYQAIATHSKEEEDVINFQLVTPNSELEEGVKGSIQLVLEKREDTLYLPLSVVHKMNDSYYVYYMDENGVQNIKSVEIGIQDSHNVEILSGLEYGEAVISK